MSYVLDLKYVALAGSYLTLFKKTKEGHYNFRCPYCGDSKQDNTKCRGWFYPRNGKIKYKCFNCDHTEKSILNFLKKQIPELYTKYLLEIMKDKKPKKVKEYKNKKVNKFKERMEYRPSKYFDVIEEGSDAWVYLLNRGIEDMSGIYFTDKFKQVTNSIVPNKFSNENEHGSQYVVFPLLNENGIMFGYQGRCITPCKKAFRFITIVFDTDELRIYGREKIDWDKTVYVVESPIDSLFLKNCVALCGASNNTRLPYKDIVYFLDSDTRNNEIVGMIKKVIDNGFKTVILPREYSGMDINDLYLEGYDVQELIDKYTFQGTKARLEIAKWSRK